MLYLLYFYLIYAVKLHFKFLDIAFLHHQIGCSSQEGTTIFFHTLFVYLISL